MVSKGLVERGWSWCAEKLQGQVPGKQRLLQLCLYLEEWQMELREEIKTIPGFAACAAGSALTQQPG